MFVRCLVPWLPDNIHGKFYGDRPRRTPPVGELNTRWVAKYSDFGPIPDMTYNVFSGTLNPTHFHFLVSITDT